jgi:hypothetical protein
MEKRSAKSYCCFFYLGGRDKDVIIDDNTEFYKGYLFYLLTARSIQLNAPTEKGSNFIIIPQKYSDIYWL